MQSQASRSLLLLLPGQSRMTARGAALRELLRSVLAQLEAHARAEPAEVDQIVGAVVAHLRAWRPESLVPLDHGFTATEEPAAVPPEGRRHDR